MQSGSPRVVISARVSQETKDRLDRLRAEGIQTGQLIDRLVSGLLKEEETKD